MCIFTLPLLNLTTVFNFIVVSFTKLKLKQITTCNLCLNFSFVMWFVSLVILLFHHWYLNCLSLSCCVYMTAFLLVAILPVSVRLTDKPVNRKFSVNRLTVNIPTADVLAFVSVKPPLQDACNRCRQLSSATWSRDRRFVRLLWRPRGRFVRMPVSRNIFTPEIDWPPQGVWQLANERLLLVVTPHWANIIHAA